MKPGLLDTSLKCKLTRVPTKQVSQRANRAIRLRHCTPALYDFRQRRLQGSFNTGDHCFSGIILCGRTLRIIKRNKQRVGSCGFHRPLLLLEQKNFVPSYRLIYTKKGIAHF